MNSCKRGTQQNVTKKEPKRRMKKYKEKNKQDEGRIGQSREKDI